MLTYLINVFKRLIFVFFMIICFIFFFSEAMIRLFGWPVWWIIFGDYDIFELDEYISFRIIFNPWAEPYIDDFFREIDDKFKD